MTVLNRADAKCICFLYNGIMIDTNIYTQFPEYGAFTCDDVKYNPDKVHIKDLLYDHYNWFEELDKTGKARPCVLDNVQKTLLCNSVYLGFDIFECPSCKNEMIIHKKMSFTVLSFLRCQSLETSRGSCQNLLSGCQSPPLCFYHPRALPLLVS